MNGMFSGCSELTSLNISNFNTLNVTKMSLMFNGCKKLKEIKGLNTFFITNATNLGGMFQNCSELEYLDISNFDTSNVTIYGIYV